MERRAPELEAAKRIDEERLAHATGTREEVKATAPLHLADVGRPVDRAIAFLTDSPEIHDAVWNFRMRRHAAYSTIFPPFGQTQRTD